MASDTLVWAIYTSAWAKLAGRVSRPGRGQSLLTDSFEGAAYTKDRVSRQRRSPLVSNHRCHRHCL